jgi:hypothetical protein
MVIGTKLVSVFLLSGLITLNVPSRVSTSRPRTAPLVLVQAAPQKNPNAGNRPGQKGGRRLDWLRAHKDLPLDQQLKELEKEPAYQRLSPQKQAAYREWVKKFNSLPPEKREQALANIDFLARLTPQQRQQLRDTNRQIEGLPVERRIAVHKAVRHLRQMPPAERQQVIQSDRFRSTFSDQEQKLISQLAELNPQEGGSAQSAQPK